MKPTQHDALGLDDVASPRMPWNLEGHAHALAPLDLGHALGGQGGDRQGHGDAMVSPGPDQGAPQRRAALHGESVGALLDPRPQGSEALHDGADAVAFLHAQLRRAGHRERLREAGGRGEGRQARR
jgi:hypothetical protein